MWKIRQEQVDALSRGVMEGFERRAVGHCRRVLTQQVRPYTDAQLRERVRACLPRAAPYGLTTEYEVLCFVDTSFLLGEWFDRDPVHAWALQVLQDSKLTPEERADLLLERACNCQLDSGAVR